MEFWRNILTVLIVVLLAFVALAWLSENARPEDRPGIPGLQLNPNGPKLPFVIQPASVSPTATRTRTFRRSGCRVSGKTKGLDGGLMRRLCAMSRSLGPVQVVSGCRTRRTNRGARNSFHLVRRGCRAADVVIPGISGRTILRHWAKHGGGGRGSYSGRRFVHVDVGPSRTWHWGRRRRRG